MNGYTAVRVHFLLRAPSAIAQPHYTLDGEGSRMRDRTNRPCDDDDSSKAVIGQTSHCVDSSCKGWLVDSFSGKYWIRCNDPKHNRYIGNKMQAVVQKKVTSPGTTTLHKTVGNSHKDEGL